MFLFFLIIKKFFGKSFNVSFFGLLKKKAIKKAIGRFIRVRSFLKMAAKQQQQKGNGSTGARSLLCAAFRVFCGRAYDLSTNQKSGF